MRITARVVRAYPISVGRLADMAICWHDDGPLHGLELLGFAISRSPYGALRVDYPRRSYELNGDRRTVYLLRPRDRTSEGNNPALDRLIFDAYDAYKKEVQS